MELQKLISNFKHQIYNMATVKEFSVEEKLTSLVTLQKIESKLDEIQILKGELPMEVSDLEDEIHGFACTPNPH